MNSTQDAGYRSSRVDLQPHVPYSAREILELGCAEGALGRAIKARQPCRYTGIEFNRQAADAAAQRIDSVIHGDASSAEALSRVGGRKYDCLIAADSLEHLSDPWTTLRQYVELLDTHGTLVVSLPNVLYWKDFIRLVRSRRWPMDDAGVFDRTHLRWFTKADGCALIEGAGLKMSYTVPLVWSSGWRKSRDLLLTRMPAGDFVPPQYLFVATKP